MSETFEMANADDPVEIIQAAQRAVIKMLRDVIADTKAEIKSPGLTWDQIEFLLKCAEEKSPKVIFQEDPV